MKILVDTNILLRRAQVSSPVHRQTLDALERLAGTNATLCLVPQVIYEFWVAATRPVHVNGLGLDPATIDHAIDELLMDFVLLRDERGIFGHWHTLVTQHQVLGKNAHDARLVAAMLRHGVTHLLTFNGADFVRYPQVTVVSPEDVQAGRLPVGV